MRERYTNDLKSFSLLRSKVLPGHNRFALKFVRWIFRNQNDLLQRGQIFYQFLNDRCFIIRFSAIVIAISRNQYFWICLSKAVKDSRGSKIRRAAGPYSA